MSSGTVAAEIGVEFAAVELAVAEPVCIFAVVEHDVELAAAVVAADAAFEKASPVDHNHSVSIE